MKTYNVPDWMVGPFVKNGFSENDHYLYGAGRALGFVRMAAYALDDPTYDTETIGHPLKVAEYHAYTGISAARTAIDATASWCNVVLDLGLKPGTQVSLTKKAFRTKVSKASPGVATYAQALSELGRKSMNIVNELNIEKGWRLSTIWIPKNWDTLVVGTLQ